MAVITAGNAGAHYPGVEANAACNDLGRVDVTLLAVSWVTDDDARRVNDRVEVFWDGAKVGEGKFTEADDFAFTVTLDLAPDGKSHTATAVAAVAFGAHQEYGSAGTSRSAEVTLPASCTTSTTSPPTTAPATTRPPTTTSAAPQMQVSSTIAGPTTTVVAQVLGTTLSALPEARVAQPQAVQPAFTGYSEAAGLQHLCSIHLAQRVGDEFYAGAVGVVEVDRRAVDLLIRNALLIKLRLDRGPPLRRHRDCQVVQAAQHLGIGPQIEAGQVEEGKRVAVADVEEEMRRTLVVAVFEHVGEREFEQVLVKAHGALDISAKECYVMNAPG